MLNLFVANPSPHTIAIEYNQFQTPTWKKKFSVTNEIKIRNSQQTLKKNPSPEYSSSHFASTGENLSEQHKLAANLAHINEKKVATYMEETKMTEICNIIKALEAKERENVYEQSNFPIRKIEY